MRRLLFLLPLVVGLVACSEKDGDVAGGPGSITTNGIAYVDGHAASYASVALRKVDFRAEEPVVENALVVADGYADENGMFDVDIPAEGEYRLTVVHNGVAFSKVVTHGDFAEVGTATKPDTVNLSPTAVMAGVVEIPEGSAGVWVGVLGTDVLVKTDENGWFALSAVPANDSLQLYFVSEDYKDDLGVQDLYLEPMESVLKDYRKEEPEDSTDTLTGMVALLEDGTPASYATVALRKANAVAKSGTVQSALVVSDIRADVNGVFKMDLPKSGSYRLTVSSGNYAYSAEYTAAALAKVDTVKLGATSTLSSKVTLKSGDSYAWVGVYGLDIMAKTNEQGFYALPNLPAGDSLNVYFVYKDTNEVYAEKKFLVEEEGSLFANPMMVLQDFENGDKTWYVSVDTLGSVFKTESVTAGIEYDSAGASKAFHGEYSLVKNDYAWVLIGISFENAQNFSAIDSITFWAKGDGQIRIALENWIKSETSASSKAASAWHSLTTSWKKIVLKPSDLCTTAMDQNDCSASWDAVKAQVKQINIFPQGGTEFYIDNVKLYGALF